MLAVTSPGFVLFAAVLAGLWFACPPPRRWQLMLGASLVFYAVLSWRTLPVLLASAFLVWWCARRAAEKGIFYAGLVAALLPLALLKYLPAALGWQGTLAGALGLGYFTLQLAGYLCDVRRGRILPEEKYLRLLCYASFFLSITQGPFNRYDKLMPQLDRPTKWDTARAWRGAQRSAWGYFKKFAVADRAAVVVDAVFANPAAFDRTQLLLGGVLFTVQLYADFSGYTDIVLGLGEVLGLELPENFRQPFFADSVKDIWARWHISLSQWLRDYVYIPLGGSRCSAAKKDRNLILTFLVSGLWHGAGLTYLVWGGLHGVCQAVENHLPHRRSGKLRHALRVLGTFCIPGQQSGQCSRCLQRHPIQWRPCGVQQLLGAGPDQQAGATYAICGHCHSAGRGCRPRARCQPARKNCRSAHPGPLGCIRGLHLRIPLYGAVPWRRQLPLRTLLT